MSLVVYICWSVLAILEYYPPRKSGIGCPAKDPEVFSWSVIATELQSDGSVAPAHTGLLKKHLSTLRWWRQFGKSFELEFLSLLFSAVRHEDKVTTENVVIQMGLMENFLDSLEHHGVAPNRLHRRIS